MITYSIVPKIFGIKYGALTIAFVNIGNFLARLLYSFILMAVLENKFNALATVEISLALGSNLVAIVIAFFMDDTLDVVSIYKVNKRLVFFSDFGVDQDPNVTQSVFMDLLGNMSYARVMSTNQNGNNPSLNFASAVTRN